MEKSFDKAQLAHLDINLREMVERSYDFCLYRCNEDAVKTHAMPCKQQCYKDITVTFRHATHIARDGEETTYRRCLANRPTFPGLEAKDFIACSNDLYHDRIKVLSDKTLQEAERIFKIARR